MSRNFDFFTFNDEPNAFLTSLYAQFDNLTFLALYRDYDLEFDNPYQRSFSNYQRYKTSILEDGYWLEDPVYSYYIQGTPNLSQNKDIIFSPVINFIDLLLDI